METAMRFLVLPFAATLAAGFAVVAQPPTKHAHTAQEHCAKVCADCMLVCEHCGTHCTQLADAGKKEHSQSAAVCRDCGSMCATAAQVAGRHGPLAAAVCKGCIEVCEACAASCEKFPDDEHMAKCATKCRECAKACAEMVKGQ